MLPRNFSDYVIEVVKPPPPHRSLWQVLLPTYNRRRSTARRQVLRQSLYTRAWLWTASSTLSDDASMTFYAALSSEIRFSPMETRYKCFAAHSTCISGSYIKRCGGCNNNASSYKTGSLVTWRQRFAVNLCVCGSKYLRLNITSFFCRVTLTNSLNSYYITRQKKVSSCLSQTYQANYRADKKADTHFYFFL